MNDWKQGNWLGTNLGHRIDLDDPDPKEIDLRDIACGLSKIARFNGQTKEFYSVAEHCMNAAKLVPPEFRLQALLHDASEAYICDVPTPLKRMLGNTYAMIELRLQNAIGEAFGVELSPLPNVVKQADRIMLVTEHNALQQVPADWGADYEGVIVFPNFEPLRATPEIVADMYIAAFHNYRREYILAPLPL
jgi:hypothetical protein